MACEICKRNLWILIGLFVFICFVSSSIAATTQGTIVQTPVDVTNTTTTISSKTASTENVNANNGSDVKISTLPDKQTSGSNGIVANTAETNTTIAGLTSSNVTTTSPVTVPTLATLPIMVPSPSSGNNDTNSTILPAISTGVAPNTTTIIPTPDISSTTVTSTITEVSKTTIVTPIIMPTNSSWTSTLVATTSNSSASVSPSTSTIVVPTPTATNGSSNSTSTIVALTSTAAYGASTTTSTMVAPASTASSGASISTKTIVTTPIQTAKESETTPVLRTKETTKASDTNGQTGSRNQCKESPFGTIGLIVFVALAVLCIVLLLILVFLLVKFKRKKTESQLPEEQKAAPKLKMLEIKDTPVKTHSTIAGANDGLQTYSLDYEKYVQQKKEEHKRKVANTSSTDANGPAVSSFLIGKKPLVMQTTSDFSSSSNQGPNSPKSPSNVNSPRSQPGTPSEKKPLISDEEPVVFNFTKTPGESLAARRASKQDTDEKRRGSSSSTKPVKGLELSPDNFTLDL